MLTSGQTEPTPHSTADEAARESRRNNVRAALVRMHAATVLFGISGIFGKLCQCSAVVLVCGRALFAVAALGCLCLLRRDPPWRGLSRRDMAGLALSGVLLTLHFVTFFMTSATSTSPKNTASISKWSSRRRTTRI